MENENRSNSNQFEIMINKKTYHCSNHLMTGTQIKQKAGVDMSYGVWLKVTGPGNDQPIGNQEEVDISRPGKNNFFTTCMEIISG